MSRVAIVTGGSSGIGLCTANALREAGCTVYEFSRRGHENPGVHHMSVDVSDEAQVKSAVEAVYAQEGRVDILINNAGFGISGASEFTENADAERLLDVNLFGAVNACKAVIPRMREQGGGRIVNLSSVAGMVAIPFQSWYSVSKYALTAYSQALANEVAPFGISVCAVMPGDIRTGFTAARRKSPVGDDVYGGRIGRSVATMEHDEQTGMAPESAGAFICRVALKKRVKPLCVIGAKYKFFSLLIKLLPCSLVKWIVGLMYAR
jgi:NAD(P)-dependent dehydrogenase (short-subunit alcohol dehydrogenase family)